MDFRKDLGRTLLFADGAMGTMLQDKGLEPGLAPERWNMARPDEVEAVHLAYLSAGCNLIAANTFGANALKCGRDAPAVIRAGLDIARRAVSRADADACVALDIGPTGRLLEPFGDLTFEDAYALFREMVISGRDADLILIETLSDLYEAKAAVLAAKENSALPVVVTLSVGADGRLLTGGDIRAAAALLEGLGVSALGLNCGLGPEEMLALLPILAGCTRLPIVVSPNAGLPALEDGRACYRVTPGAFASAMTAIADGGAAVVGGCCGTTPKHLQAMVGALRGRAARRELPAPRTVVSSYARAVCLDDGPVLIGERINPTGRPRLKAALRADDLAVLARDAVLQADAGAHMLDVNVGLPGLDEPDVLARAVALIQGVTAAPLSIDTANPEAMERALRVYNGRPMLNSVTGKRESMDAVLPLAKKYGAVVVALTLGDHGIPETVDGRLAIARRILDEAARYGIAPTDIVLDALTLPVSAGAGNARVALETMRRARAELNVHTVLGLSNVSFGLPRREKLNAAFLAMALSQGLSACIADPLSEEIRDAFHVGRALTGRDPACADYIERFAQAPEARPDPAGELTLREAIARGLAAQARALAGRLADEQEPLTVVDGELIPALDEVGRAYEAGRAFLPQLLMSADAAKACFEALRERMGGAPSTRGKVVLATVKGDIHDIGKNIVKALLQNYGFAVIDLGKDVPPEAVVRRALEEGARLVGLSALMTTTVGSMGETIQRLRAAGDFKVMVGGAVLTESYARRIGADFYGRDAMSAVRYACECVGDL